MRDRRKENTSLSSLVDIREVKVDRNLPTEDRVRSYVEQVKDPYCFRVGDVKVRVSYTAGEKTLNDSFRDMFASM